MTGEVEAEAETEAQSGHYGFCAGTGVAQWR